MLFALKVVTFCAYVTFWVNCYIVRHKQDVYDCEGIKSIDPSKKNWFNEKLSEVV